MMASIIGGWEWFWRQESQMVDWHAIEARKLAFQARWPEAIMVLEEALSQLEPRVVCESLRRRVTDLLELYTKKEKEWMAQEKERMAQERDVKFVRALDDARLLGAANAKEGGYDRKAVISGYQRAFREYGIDIDTLPPERTAELIRAKPPEIREALAAALDDWAWRAGPPEESRLSTIAREADSDPQRKAIRDAVAKRDAPALRQLARDREVARQPVATLARLGNALVQVLEFDEAVGLLRQAQSLYPHDFWINHDLADAFTSSKPAQYDEAVRYYTAAVATRSDSPGANDDLGLALDKKGQIDEAFVWFDRAIRLDRGYAVAYNNRGYVWYAKKDYDRALADYDAAIRLEPKWAWAYNNRGRAWYAKKEYDKAIADYDAAIRLDPKFAWAYDNRGDAWRQAGVRQGDRRLRRGDPPRP